MPLRPTAALLFLTAGVLPQIQAAPRVALFDEPLFPTFAGAQGLMPDDVRQAFEDAGLPAELIDTRAVADANRFTAAAFPVLVHLYGNTFPQPAVDALKAFRKAGGSVVSFGVPFCHPCIEKGVAGWSTTGEIEDLVTRTDAGRNGTPGVLLRRVGTTEGMWTGMWTPKMRTRPGTRWRVGAWVKSRGHFDAADCMYVRFWDRAGKFLGQTGPTFPPDAVEWTRIESEVTTPDATHAFDVCLALFHPGEVTCDDLSLTRAPSDEHSRPIQLRNDPQRSSSVQRQAGGEHPGPIQLRNGPRSHSAPAQRVGEEHSEPIQLRNVPAGGVPGGNRVRDPGFDDTPAQQWHDVGHVNDYLGHDGLGMGGFRIVQSNGRLQYAPTQGDPIGLGEMRFPAAGAGPQAVIDETTFPTEDKVFQLFATLGRDGNPVGSGVTFIEHHCRQFDGALDVWAGYPAPPPREALQVLLHSCAFILQEKGVIDDDAAAKAHQFARDLPVETERTYPLVPAVRRETVLPKSPPPGDTIVVTSLLGLSWEEQILVRALQGLVNRARPTIYFEDAWTEPVGQGRKRQWVEDPYDLLDRYGDACGGAVVYDPAFPPSINVAVSIAGARDLLPCSAELAERFGLTVKEDLRGRWTNLADAYAWATENVLPECSKHVVCHIKQGEPLTPTASEMSASMVDYLVAHRVFSFHLNRAFSQRERRVVEDLLAKYPAQTPVIGYFGPEPGGAPNLTNEWDIVEILSRMGKYFIFTVNGNLSFHSGFPSVRGRQTRREPLRYDPSKVYVAFYLSDGDSPTTYYNVACRWGDESRGDVPLGWSFPVAALDVCPLVAQQYHDEATPNDELVTACTGIGYCYPQVYGSRIEGGEALLSGFLAETARGIERAGMSVVHVHHHAGTTDKTLARFANEIPGLQAVFADYGRTRTDYATSHFAAGDVPVFHCLTTGGNRQTTDQKAADEMLAQILEVTPQERPAFIVAFGIYWFMGPDEIKSVVDRLAEDYVAVLPSELAELYRQWRESEIR